MREWVCRAASVAGSSHESRGAESNDAFATWLDGRTAIVAVADGAGSAENSTFGATIAVDAALASLRLQDFGSDQSESTRKEYLRTAVECALAAVLERATELGVESGSLASTLLLCVASDDGVFAAQVGDGAIVSVVGNVYQLLCAPPRGEFLNETIFLTSEEAFELLTVTHHTAVDPSDLRHIAVFSDGLQALALDLADDTPHSPFFNPLFAWVVETDASESTLTDFLRSARVREKTDDDVTLVLLADPSAEPPAIGAVSPDARFTLGPIARRTRQQLRGAVPRVASTGRRTLAVAARQRPRVRRVWDWIRRA